MVSRVKAFSFFAFLVLIQAIPNAHAQNDCQELAGQFLSLEGTVDVQSDQTGSWTSASLDQQLCKGDTVRVSSLSRAAVSLVNDAVLRLDENTTMRLLDITAEQEERSFLDLLRGAFHSFSRKPRLLSVNTPYLNGSIEGTEFVFRVKEGESTVTVFEGTVIASNEQGSMPVTRGESVAAVAGQAPQARILVRPRDAAQWSLHYPPLLAAGVDRDTSPALRKAVDGAGQGDVAGSLEALDEIPQDQHNAEFHTLRASLLLNVGQVDAAQKEIDQALAKDTGSALAYAQRAVISLVQNDTGQALQDANRAVTLDPDSSAARIALSYVQQANFNLAAARETLLSAVDADPENALAWARLSELELMLGDRRQAVANAEKAVALEPELARPQITLGFAQLAQFNQGSARSAFEKAIELDSADPLPRLGLGLAKISNGDLEHGRADIEAAVALGSNNALYRAYLGKAYFDEKRNPLDAEQFSIAKELDPRDPTAYLYDGTLKQSINRPIEAVEDFERSIELNDNRAAYRGRFLLDEDRAARGTSLARAYKDLGFYQLGINESAKSLELDPSNASAHRFLSDTYVGVPRHEIARVSEQYQSQMMQDVNINPVQPSLSETNLNIVTLGGPSSAGFGEFTPLFGRNSSQFNISGIAGNNDTYGGEAVVSGLHNQLSYSIGGFAYKTDGWRENGELEQNVYDIFLQGAVSPELNLQLEVQHRDSEEGDLALQFDPEDIVLDKMREIDRDSARVGLRYSPDMNSDVLLSYIHSDTNEIRREADEIDPFTSFTLDSDRTTKGGMFEAQYIYKQERFKLVTGGAYSDPDTVIDETAEVVDVDFGPLFSEDARIEEKIEHPRAYIYSYLDSSDSLTWTLGASYDDFTDEPIEETTFSPKLGMRLQASDSIVLRAAAFRVVKPSFINNRTIEPTQVAGFNQFFDDLPGTESTRYGAGLDWRADESLWGGIELSWRDLEEPTKIISETGEEQAQFDDQKENLHRLYLYWTPSERWAAQAALVYDKYEGEGLAVEFGPRPQEVETVSLPLSVSYFHPNGVFASVSGTFVDQEVMRAEGSPFAAGQDDFFVVDLAVGYRLPKRRGILSIGVKNLFDEEFMYQDNSFREFSEEAVSSPFVPSRLILARATISF